MMLFPSSQQWAKWSLVAKTGYIGSVASVIGVILAIVFYFVPLSTPASNPPVNGEKSFVNNSNGINLGVINQTIEHKTEIKEANDKKIEDQLPETLRDPIVQHDSKFSIVAIFHIINDLSEVVDCGASFKFPATIVNRTYDPVNRIRLNGIVVKAKDGSRGFINVTVHRGLEMSSCAPM